MAWYNHLSHILQDMGFRKSIYDPCFFILDSDPSNVTLVGTYVDDILVASQSSKKVTDFETRISTVLKVKLLGEVKRILGWQIDRNVTNGTVTISQPAYIEQVLSAFGMTDCNPAPTPAVKAQHLSEQDNEDHSNDFPYRQAIGSLMYISNSTRPDVAQAVHHAARFVRSPSTRDILRVKRIMRYLRGTSLHGIVFRNTLTPSLCGYTDSDYASSILDPRSTSGWIFYTNGPKCWSSRQQKVTAVSTTEAEVNALFVCYQGGFMVVSTTGRNDAETARRGRYHF